MTIRGSGNFQNAAAINKMNQQGKDVATQTYGQHMTVFYRYVNEKPGPIVVIGYGEHDGSNKEYSVQWADGTKTGIDLRDKGGKTAESFLGGATLGKI